MKKHGLYLGIIWLLLAIILPLPLIVILNFGLVDSIQNIIAYSFGIVAYVWWLAIVYLGTRPKWITSKIGVPSTYMMHGMLAVFALVAATIHKFTSSSYHAIIRNTGNIAWYLAIFLLVYAIFFLSGWLSDRSNAIRNLKAKLEKAFNHQFSVWIHRLNFVVIGLIWLHVNVIPRIANISYFLIVFDIYTLVFITAYAYQKFISDADMRNSGTVKENIPLTPNIQKFTIDLNKTAKPYHAGDFYFVSFRGKGISSEAHPFSVMTRPSKHEVGFIIHQVGDFTKKITHVSPGTKVHLDGPYGLFNSEVEETNGPVILYAIGTGIAPLISLAEEYAGKKALHIIWSTSSSEDYFNLRLDQLEQNGVKVDKKQHRFSDEELNTILTNEEKANGKFFIVGSAPIILTVKEKLKQLGINDSNLIDEHLTM